MHVVLFAPLTSEELATSLTLQTDRSQALPEAGHVLEFISSAVGVVVQECTNATVSTAAADAPVGPEK